MDTHPVVTLRNITWRRGTQTILTGVNWEIFKGEHWALIGRNGSGKTSLLNILTGYIWPTIGGVEVLGHSFGTVDLRQLRKFIGWVSSSFLQELQSLGPIQRTLDVVVSGKFASMGVYEQPSTEDWSRAERVLDWFGCSDLAHHAFTSLSQGEKQRVLLARAWMGSPQLLILDEPCTGLDVPSREQILRAIDTLAKQPNGPTLVYVTHHVEEVVPSFTHALVLNQGQVLASGRKNEILTGNTLSKAFSLPVEVNWQSGRPWLQVRSDTPTNGPASPGSNVLEVYPA